MSTYFHISHCPPSIKSHLNSTKCLLVFIIFIKVILGQITFQVKPTCNKLDGQSNMIKFDQFVNFTEFSFNGTNYTFVLKPTLSWNDAVGACASNCGILTSIQSHEEYRALHDHIKMIKNDWINVWVGGTDQRIGVYEWIENYKPILSSLWERNEPNNLRGNEHCMKIDAGVVGLNDILCSHPAAFMCKMLPRDPSTGVMGQSPQVGGQPKRECISGSQKLSLFQDYKSRQERDHVYVLVRKPRLTWDEAAFACSDNCGVLTSVQTIAEKNFISILFHGVDGAWVGGMDRINKEYRWLENMEPIQDFFWASGQPDNWEGAEHCTELNYRSKAGNDYECAYKHQFICKFQQHVLAASLIDQIPKVFVKLLVHGQVVESSNEGREVTFKSKEDPRNMSLVCLVYGHKKTGHVSWTRNDEPFDLHVNTHIQNTTFTWSQINFPKIYKSTSGRYVCHAANDGGENSAAIRIQIEVGEVHNNNDQSKKSENNDQSKNSENKGIDNTTTIIATSVSVILILLVVSILLVLLWCQMKRLKSVTNRSLTAQEMMDFYNGDLKATNSDETNPNISVSKRPYDRKFEVPRHCLQLDEHQVLGSGNFGIVVKGYVVKPSGERQLVAVKAPKQSSFDVSNLLSMLTEIKIMAYLDHHENIANLVAANTDNIANREAFAAIEYCENGNLIKFFKRTRHRFQNLFEGAAAAVQTLKESPKASRPNWRLSTLTLLDFSRGVAEGMKYLTEKDIIHGDIAARNILITGNLIPKISDFGLSRVLIDYTNYVKKSVQPLPLRWLAVETLMRKEFSIKSDVWSYGILLWEIFSLAESMPYPQFELNQKFVDAIINGHRMNIPDYANNHLYDLMKECWQKEPRNRPPFDEIEKRISQILTTVSQHDYANDI